MSARSEPQSSVSGGIDYAFEEELVSGHLALVGYLVSELLGRLPAHVSRDELMSAGLSALAHAARSYDRERGVPFSSFASTRIRGALIDELRSHDWASRSVRSLARRRDCAEDDLTGRLGRAPTPAELATSLGVPTSEVEAVQGDVQRALVLSLQGFGDGAAAEEHVSGREPAPEDVVLQRERVGYLLDAVEELPRRLLLVITRYFFEDCPMAEIAAELGVTDSRVSQLRTEALSLLCEALNAQLDPGLVRAPARPEGCAARRRAAYVEKVAGRSDYKARISAGDIDLRDLRRVAVA